MPYHLRFRQYKNVHTSSQMGKLPLNSVANFKGKLTHGMRKMGEFLLSIYSMLRFPSPSFLTNYSSEPSDREAMWINFKARNSFTVKVYVCGIKTGLGKPQVEGEQDSPYPDCIRNINSRNILGEHPLISMQRRKC